jgi:hypothetical protein
VDQLSLSLPAGASATSPPMCISLLSSKMRFLTRGSSGCKVKVQIIYRGLLSSVLGILDGRLDLADWLLECFAGDRNAGWDTASLDGLRVVPLHGGGRRRVDRRRVSRPDEVLLERGTRAFSESA